jgi:hypothetical protein
MELKRRDGSYRHEETSVDVTKDGTAAVGEEPPAAVSEEPPAADTAEPPAALDIKK